MLPFSFRLSGKDHSLELAAACQREKVAWMTSIRESLLHHDNVSWINEPVSSFRVLDDIGELIPSSLDGPFEMITSLPTILSSNDVADSGHDKFQSFVDALASSSPGSSAQNQGESTNDKEGERADLRHAPPSRCSSTTSVKAIFSHSSEMDTIVIRRPGPSSRSTVDLGLQDVISEPCITARTYATSREQELFGAPHITRGGASLTITKSGLKRHESVRVPRRKPIPSTGGDMARNASTRSLTVKSSRPPHTRHRSKHLSIGSLEETNQIYVPPALNTASTVSSEDAIYFPPSSLDIDTGEQSSSPILRQNSVILGVRGIFSSRRPSPDSPHSMTSGTSPHQQRANGDIKTPSRSILRRWVSGVRWRTQSAPEGPSNFHLI